MTSPKLTIRPFPPIDAAARAFSATVQRLQKRSALSRNSWSEIPGAGHCHLIPILNLQHSLPLLSLVRNGEQGGKHCVCLQSRTRNERRGGRFWIRPCTGGFHRAWHG